MILLDAIKARLIDECRRWWKLWSVRWNALGALLMPLLILVPALPNEVQGLMPLKARAVAAGLYCLIGIALRLTAQKKLNG